MKKFNVGDSVYVEGLTSFAKDYEAKVIKTEVRYNTRTGIPYDVIKLECGNWFNAESGEPLNHNYMFYISVDE